MSLIATTYQLSSFGSVLSHFPQRLSWVRDTDEDVDAEMLSQARVRSGDYFMTLATELDKLAQGIARSSDAEAAQMERLVTELLYLNRTFKITKKD